jgi:hypothetical protein
MYLRIRVILFHVSRHLHVVPLHRDNEDNVRVLILYTLNKISGLSNIDSLV